MDPTEVEYELTPDDLFAFQLYATKHSRTAKRLNRYTYMAYGGAILLLALLSMPWFSLIALAGFIVSLVTFIALAYWSTGFLTRRAIRDYVSQEIPEKGQLGKHRIRLDEHGITESTAVGESRVSWAGIDRVEQTSDAVLVYTTPTAAHMIPRRAFKSQAEQDSFVQMVESSIAKTRQTPTSGVSL